MSLTMFLERQLQPGKLSAQIRNAILLAVSRTLLYFDATILRTLYCNLPEHQTLDVLGHRRCATNAGI